MARTIAILCLLFCAPTVFAGDAALTALSSTVGSWEGELYYLDYGSGERYSIPLRVDAKMSPDNASLIRELTFSDPGRPVSAVSLTTVTPGGDRLIEAYFRERSGEHAVYDISEIKFESPTRWRIVYEHAGTDDDRPAQIRHILQRHGDSLSSSKHVRFAESDDGEFFLRNGTELELAATY